MTTPSNEATSTTAAAMAAGMYYHNFNSNNATAAPGLCNTAGTMTLTSAAGLYQRLNMSLENNKYNSAPFLSPVSDFLQCE